MDINRICLGCMKELSEGVKHCPYCGYNNENMSCEQNIHHLKPYTILAEKYLVGRVLGEGGFGITYIGMDLNLEMKVAIKEFYPNGFVTREGNVTNMVTDYAGVNMQAVQKWKDGFIREARTLAKCSNLSGIVGVKDFFQENNTAYIIMEYLEGETLKEHLKRVGGKMPVQEVISLMRPVITSLSKMHELGLIHRDISPDNIMMLPSGNVKLLDLGAARDYATEGERSLSVMLKPGYAPEEQYRTKGKQGPWSDVYALCATIYKCITGVTPPESMERMREDALQKPSALGITISKDKEEIILKGMEVFAEKRIQNMNELYEMLYENKNDVDYQDAEDCNTQDKSSSIELKKIVSKNDKLAEWIDKIKQIPTQYYHIAGIGIVILILGIMVIFNMRKNAVTKADTSVEEIAEETVSEEQDKYAELDAEWKKSYAKQLDNEHGKIQRISLIRIEQSGTPIIEYIVNKDENNYTYVVSSIDENDIAKKVIEKKVVNNQYEKATINSDDKILFSEDDTEYLYSYDTNTASYQQVYEVKGPFDDAEVGLYHIYDHINEVETIFYEDEEFYMKCDEITGKGIYNENESDTISFVYTEDDAQEYSVDEYFDNINIPFIDEGDDWKKAYIDFIKEHEGVNKRIEIFTNNVLNRPVLEYGVTISDMEKMYYVCYADNCNRVQVVIEECINANYGGVMLESNGNLSEMYGMATGWGETIYSYNSQTDQYQKAYSVSEGHLFSDNCYEINGTMYLEEIYEKKRNELIGNPDYVPMSERAEWKCEAEGDDGVDIFEFLSGVNLE